jgi:hypothetical protein
VGSNFATCWGSVGFFGPLTTRPDLWESGIGQRLVAATCLYAVIAGRRSGSAVTFLKTYQNAPLGYGVVNYGGTLNADHTEIEGSWQIPRNWFGLFLSWSGKFLMIRHSGVEESVAREVSEFV